MRIFDGKEYREQTEEEKLEVLPSFEEDKPSIGDDALAGFFEGLASTDTNSIAKIRALAQAFIDSTKEAQENV